MSLNILFAFAAGFTVANLYYNHPILNILARDFHVPYEKVAQIPTVMQAGYASGLLFLCPLGDLLPRRPFVVGLVGFTATVWYVLLSLGAGGGLIFLFDPKKRSPHPWVHDRYAALRSPALLPFY
jgi:MFS family permease